MWIQLTSIQQIEQAGVVRTFHPGDWVEIGKLNAMALINSGQARIPGSVEEPKAERRGEKLAFEEGTGLMLTGSGVERYEGARQFDGSLAWKRTVIWDGATMKALGMFQVGLGLVAKGYEIAAPIFDYKVLAAHVGSGEERELTKEVIHDLRTPLYDTRLLFVRRTKATSELMAAWMREPGDRRLAFLRCVYRIKPFILPLPMTWTQEGPG